MTLTPATHPRGTAVPTVPTVPAALAVLAGAVVALQIAYPLTSGAWRDRLTVSIVALFALTCLGHAAATRGTRFAGTLLLVTAGPGFAAEVVGVHTGVPFGDYSYAGTLGPQLVGVPLVVALAWTMLAWPAALAARRLVASFAGRVLVGTWGLASADLFLDPQMVADGYWQWRGPFAHLPGVADVPLTNLAGWVLVAAVLSLLLQWLLDSADPATPPAGTDTVPIALYLWWYMGWTVALAIFLRQPVAATWGAAGMGVVAVPLAARMPLRRSAGAGARRATAGSSAA